jgi:hypothetical protein
MSHFKHHVFFCLNQRDDGSACCANHNAAEMQAYAKDRVKKLGLAGEDKHDIDEIIDSHLVRGKVVERLKI